MSGIETQLPHGWTPTHLSQIADWGSGGTPSRKNPAYFGGSIPWVKTGELDQGLIIDTEEKITELGLQNSSAKLFPKGSVAIAMYGATIGKTGILGIDATTNQACAVGTPIQGLISTEYLYYYLTSQKDAFTNAGKGGAQPNISQAVVKEWPIPLAPFNEQKRIADTLDELLSRFETCHTHLKRVPNLIKQFRQAVLAAATSGRLTEEWREENGQNKLWQKRKIAEVGEMGRGKSKHRPRNDARLYNGPYPFIQTGDIARSKGYVEAHSQTYSEFGLSQSKLWPKGTVCITIAANIADTAILTYPACFPDSVVGFIACEGQVYPEFMKWSIDVIKENLEAFAPATAQKNINLSILEDLLISIPGIKEQEEIVRRVNELFAFADSLEARYQAAMTQIEQLTPSLLAKAFRGELVPQDPNDEPASALLERIRVSKETDTGKKPQRAPKAIKKNKTEALAVLTRSDVQPDHLSNLLKQNGPLSPERLWSASQLEIEAFYEQLKEEESKGLLIEHRPSEGHRLLEAA